jgi:thiol:disulfide interchange protein DsbD
MKKLIVLFICLNAGMITFSQDPVKWNYTAKKIGEGKYEVKLTASIQSGWHLYSQMQPESAIAQPTEIKFNKNPLLTLDDKMKEVGTMQKYKDEGLDVEAWQYSGKVEFVQKVKLKTNAKTMMTGSVEYQVCTDEKCLPPKTVPFSILIQ